MKKSIGLVWAGMLAACVPATTTVTTDGCEVSQAELSAWEAAKAADTAKAYQAYLGKFPDGCFAATATARLRTPVVPPKVSKVKAGQGTGTGGAGVY